MVAEGRVSINGRAVSVKGAAVGGGDVVEVDGRAVCIDGVLV